MTESKKSLPVAAKWQKIKRNTIKEMEWTVLKKTSEEQAYCSLGKQQEAEE